MTDISLSEETEEQLTALTLIYAVQYANIECVKSTIAKGANANIFARTYGLQYIPTDTDMFSKVVSSLIVAIKLLHPKSYCSGSSENMMEIFDVLLDSVSDVNIPCPGYQRTPIMYAAEVGNVRCVEKLIHKGAALHTADDAGHTAWTLAARAGSVDVLKCLIEDHGIDKDSINEDGIGMLYFAVKSGNIEAVRYLVKLGVTLKKSISQERYVETWDGWQLELPCHFIHDILLRGNPYMAAINMNMPEVVKLLEEHGCQLYKSDKALRYAVHMKSVDVVVYLLSNHTYQLNRQYTNQYDWDTWYPHQTLLKSACQKNSVKMVELLLKYGADPNIKRCVCKCPGAINAAINDGHVEIVARLIRSGVDVNARSDCPFIGVVLPFEAAVHCSNIYNTEMLLAYGCSGGVHSLGNKHTLKTNVDPDLQELLKEWQVHKNNVLPLKKRCRMVILNQLSPQTDKKIKDLPLPPTLHKYLRVPELDDIMEMFTD